MPKKPKTKPTEQTAKGLTVPTPKRGDFFRNLAKVAKACGAKDRDEDRTADSE